MGKTNLPVNGKFSITAAYGDVNPKLWKKGHLGIDITGNKTIYSPVDGTVRIVDYDPKGYGYYVTIGDSKKRIHLLGHMAKGSIRVKPGDKVTRTTIIGTMGSTGNSTGIHLHYQINSSRGNPMDPSKWTHVPNKRGSYNASDFQVDDEGTLITKPEEKPGTFKVQITASGLYVRQGPGTHYRKLAMLMKGSAHTIVETSEGRGSTAGWGKLENGTGWISLDYAKKK